WGVSRRVPSLQAPTKLGEGGPRPRLEGEQGLAWGAGTEPPLISARRIVSGRSVCCSLRTQRRKIVLQVAGNQDKKMALRRKPAGRKFTPFQNRAYSGARLAPSAALAFPLPPGSTAGRNWRARSTSWPGSPLCPLDLLPSPDCTWS